MQRKDGRIVGISTKSALIGAVALFVQPVLADEVSKITTLDDLGFDTELSSYRIRSNTSTTTNKAPTNKARQIESVIDIQSEKQDVSVLGLSLDEQSSQNFKIQRFVNTIETSKGVLSAGRNWNNFQDYLGAENVGYDFDDQALTSEQLAWRSQNGFGIALENEFLPYGLDGSTELDSTPSLILSWQGSDSRNIGQYSISTLGHETEHQKKTGWGLNVAGGWQVGDFFAALSVTLGNSIDRFVLGGKNSTPGANSQVIQLNDSVNVNPRLNYSLSDNANLHLALNRYESLDGNAVHGIQTLDTIHVGYTWKPWPSTQFGVELIGKEVEGATDQENSSEVNFAVRKKL